MNHQKNLSTNKKGFTMMELLVVVAVLIILVLIIFLVINPKTSINKAYDARRKKDLESLSIAFENYYSDYSCYPTQEQIDNCDTDDLDPYIKEIPCDPVYKVPYELVAVPAVCPQNFIAYSQLKYEEDPEADSFNCISVTSPNVTNDPDHDCTEYFSSLIPTGTPSPSGTPTPSPSGTPTPSPSGTPTPEIPYYYCSSLNNCTELPTGKTCNPNFPFPDTNCSGACSNPANICTPL